MGCTNIKVKKINGIGNQAKPEDNKNFEENKSSDYNKGGSPKSKPVNKEGILKKDKKSGNKDEDKQKGKEPEIRINQSEKNVFEYNSPDKPKIINLVPSVEPIPKETEEIIVKWLDNIYLDVMNKI